MTALVALLWLGAAGQRSDFQLPRYDAPLRDRVALHLTTERQLYVVHEPLRLHLVLKNESAAPVRGCFMLTPATWHSQIYDRHAGMQFARLAYLDRGGDTVGSLRTLKPGEEVGEEVVLTFDPVRDQFVLDGPGQYQFKVVYQDAPEQPNAVLESNVVSLDVVGVDGDDQRALDSYSRELALIAQHEPSRWRATGEDIERALAFIRDFPDSPYTAQLRRGFRRTLEFRVGTNLASEEERLLLEGLRREGPPPDHR